MTDTDVLLRIHDILFGKDAYKKDYEQYYLEIGTVMIGWAREYFLKQEKKQS